MPIYRSSPVNVEGPVSKRGLPPPSPEFMGRTAFVSNGRKPGEDPGQGTGVAAYDDGTNWVRSRDDQPVSI